MKHAAALLACAFPLAGRASAAEPSLDHWQPVQRLVGDWSRAATGASGEGTVKRRYALVINGRCFIHETNITTCPPQEKNKAGEVHEHWGVFSFDKARRTIVLRQFHVEGFVNTYRHAEPMPGAATALVFESESFENFSNAWARETYEFLSDDEFVGTFDPAPPGKPFQPERAA